MLVIDTSREGRFEVGEWSLGRSACCWIGWDENPRGASVEKVQWPWWYGAG